MVKKRRRNRGRKETATKEKRMIKREIEEKDNKNSDDSTQSINSLGRGGRRLACTGKAFPCAQCSTAKEPCPDQSEGGVRRRSLDDTG